MLKLNFTPFPVIITPRLVLRQLQDDDLHSLFALRTNPEVNRYLDRPVPQSSNDVRKFIKIINGTTLNNEGLYWAITFNNEGKLLGTIGLRNFIPGQCQAEVGYELHPDYQGQGIMNEAITDVLSHAFEQIGLRKIIAETVPENLPSIKILKGRGFVKSNDLENTYVLTNKQSLGG